MSEKTINITKYNLGQTIKDINCPRCKSKVMRLVGIYHGETKSYELECYSCFHTERVNPKQVEFTYEPPKEPKKRKDEKKEGEE